MIYLLYIIRIPWRLLKVIGCILGLPIILIWGIFEKIFFKYDQYISPSYHGKLKKGLSKKLLTTELRYSNFEFKADLFLVTYIVPPLLAWGAFMFTVWLTSLW